MSLCREGERGASKAIGPPRIQKEDGNEKGRVKFIILLLFYGQKAPSCGIIFNCQRVPM